MVNLKFGQEEKHHPVVCVICRNPFSPYVTFIRVHIERLPTKVRVLYGHPYFYYAPFFRTYVERLPAKDQLLHGRHFPSFQDDHLPLLPFSLPSFLRRIARPLLKLPSATLKKAALKRFLVENKVDAVLAESGKIGVAVMETCKEVNLPLLVYFRGNDAFCYPELEREGYPELFEQAVAIFGDSHEIEHQLQRLGAPAEKLHYDPSGADTSLFQGSEPSHSPPTFVAVGRFVEKKAPHLTLQAFKQVWASVPETRLIMIGEGALWKNCKQLSQNLGIAHAVQFFRETGQWGSGSHSAERPCLCSAFY